MANVKAHHCGFGNSPKGKKALRETQTLRAGCSNAEPKNFAPPQTPFPGAQDGQNLTAGDGLYLYLQTQFGEDRCMQFRVIVVTDPQKLTQPTYSQTHTIPQTGPITIHCAAAIASAQCNAGYIAEPVPRVSKTTSVPSLKSFRSGISFHRANIHTHRALVLRCRRR